jgi:hypothetical protein
MERKGVLVECLKDTLPGALERVGDTAQAERLREVSDPDEVIRVLGLTRRQLEETRGNLLRSIQRSRSTGQTAWLQQYRKDVDTAYWATFAAWFGIRSVLRGEARALN